MERRHAVLAVRPAFAQALVQGRKRIEFRRVRPSLGAGDIVYVYATSPIQAVVGTFVCGPIVEAQPEDLWQRFAQSAGTPKSFFASYFDGSQRGCAIKVMEPRPWASPLTLDRLRARVPDFRPPRSYMFLSEGEALIAFLTRYSRNGAVEPR